MARAHCPCPTAQRRLIVLGCTGSIGVNTLQVVEHLNASREADFQIVGLAAGSNARLLIEQARHWNVAFLALADPAAAEQVQDALPQATVFSGPQSALDLVQAVEATDLAAAVVGAAGLPATLAGIERGMAIHLANKETLVAAGALVKPAVERHGVNLLPVDSEHSAIFQCLHEHPHHRIKRIVLTASGGPFRTTDRETMFQATVEEALNHPTWTMGRKITIDSATMMNKALEIIEAHWLFDLPGDQIDVLIHPQSIIHSFVEFADHSVLAQLGPPDMRTPIQYALTWPDRPGGCGDAMDWAALRNLSFEPPDPDRFASLPMAYQVIEAGGSAGAIFNAANEAAVEAFLDRRIRFGEIFDLVHGALDAVDGRPVAQLEDVLEADRQARAWVRTRLAQSTATR